MSTRRLFLKSATALVAAGAALTAPAAADEPIPVVATFSILGDMVARVGGAHVALTTLVGPDGDTHFYQPTPQAAAALSGAELVFANGLEFETWLERLAEAASFDGQTVVVSEGVAAIAYEDHDGHDGHDDHGHGDDDHDDDHVVVVFLIVILVMDVVVVIELHQVVRRIRSS
jgi:zinc/manganese transport system substrate-binding protein